MSRQLSKKQFTVNTLNGSSTGTGGKSKFVTRTSGKASVANKLERKPFVVHSLSGTSAGSDRLGQKKECCAAPQQQAPQEEKPVVPAFTGEANSLTGWNEDNKIFMRQQRANKLMMKMGL